MCTLPEYILVVVCKHSESDKKGVSEILKEYFNGMPYLQYISPSLYDSNDTYYIFPYINTFRAILYNIEEMVCEETIDVLGYVVYERSNFSPNTYMKTNNRELFNYRYFPLSISIDLNDIPKLHSLQD